MRKIPFENNFDAIVNMYSSFGYLESEAEDLKVLESAAKALKAGGRLLLDMLNREWAIDNYIQNDWHTGADGTLYVERRDLDLATSRMHVHFIVVDPNGSRRESIGHIIRLYTLTEMTRLLERVGLHVTAVFGGFDSEAYAIGTRRMIIVARSRGQSLHPSKEEEAVHRGNVKPRPHFRCVILSAVGESRVSARFCGIERIAMAGTQFKLRALLPSVVAVCIVAD